MGGVGLGLSCELARKLLVGALKTRPGNAEVRSIRLQFLRDNEGDSRNNGINAEVRRLALTPTHTPVCSAQLNGMAKIFLTTLKPGQIRLMYRNASEMD